MSGVHLVGLRLTNWRCFRGVHELELGPGAYAIQAQHDDDRDRSNWLGKSSLLWAIRFLMTGDHPDATEDEWIARGETVGGVDGEFSDGTFVSRERKLGDATRLLVTRPIDGGERRLDGDAAQAELDAWRCMNKDEDLTTWWIEQKMSDRFVREDPAVRTRMIARWLELGPIQAAHAHAAEWLRDIVKERDAIAAVCESTAAQAVELWQQLDVEPKDVGGLVLGRDALRREVSALRASAETDAETRRVLARVEQNRRDAEEHARLSDELEEVDATIAELPPPVDEFRVAAAEQAAADAAAVLAERARDEQSKRTLARGRFDGKCPVGGIACPATAQLNADVERNEQLLRDAAEAKALARKAADTARESVAALAAERNRLSQLEFRREKVVVALARVEAGAKAHARAAQVTREDPDAATKLWEAQQKLDKLEKDAAMIERLQKTLLEKNARLQDMAPDVQAHCEAVAILGRAGVQRRLAEGLLASIADDVNRSLADCGVALHVRFEWARETDKLADACGQCGAPFPASRKVRLCATCGGARGNKLDEKLRVVMSDRSGGADDLVGLATCLAGGAWLRARRGSPWSIACIDEAFAHVDLANRRAMGRHLLSLLSGEHGYDQAFVTAHDTVTLASLPRRILIEAGASGSRVRVVG